MSRISDPIRDAAEERMLRYLASRPDMLAGWLERMGANRIRPIKGGFHCTCPIHDGDNPNGFALWYEKGVPLWKCYTDCGAGGPLTTLIMRRYDVSRAKAVAWMAARSGFSVGKHATIPRDVLEEESLEAWKRRMGLGKQVARPNVFPEWMVEQSMSMRHDYFLDQGLPQDTLDRFEVGFVPGGTWVRHNDDTGKDEGWFEDRISIPYRDASGQLLGFAGRRVDGQDFLKYKTLPGTDRRFAVYGLHLPETKAAISQTRELYLMEGYKDVMRSHQHDCCNVAAVAGTDLAPEQVQIIKSLDLDGLVAVMDGDDPGRMASERVVRQFHGSFRVKQVFLPEGVDPGDIKDGQEFWSMVKSAQPAFITKGSRSL